VVLSLTDITAHKTLEDRLAHLAFHDALTGLPNRSLFVDRLQQNLARAMRHKHLTVVLFIDLDNFKMINDSLGHMAGDALLSGVAHRLQDCIRAEDTAARLGGDEFAILLDNISDAGQAVVVVEHILNSFEAPILVEGRELFITPSIGIAVSSSEDDATQVLRNADAAMYEAKRKAKVVINCFTPTSPKKRCIIRKSPKNCVTLSSAMNSCVNQLLTKNEAGQPLRATPPVFESPCLQLLNTYQQSC
jgi:diguanylate cyclase (GGDEF)-like protein